MAEPDNRPPWEIFGTNRDRSVFPEMNPPAGAQPWELYGTNAPHLHSRISEDEIPLGTSEFQRRHPRFWDRFLGGVRHIAQGAPVIGPALISENEASRDFGRTYPITSGLGRLALATGVLLPQARAVQGLSTAVGNLVRRGVGMGERSTPGIVSNTLGQGGFGAYVNTADTAVRRRNAGLDNDLDSLLFPGMLGAASGVLGPLGSRILAPAGVGNRVRYDPRITPPIIHDLQDAPLIRRLSTDPGFLSAFRQDIRAAAAAGRLGPGRRPPNLDRSMHFINAERGRQIADRVGGTLGSVIAPIGGAALGGGSGGGLMGALYGALGGASLNVLARAAARSPTGQRYLGRTIPSEWQALIDSIGPSGMVQVPIQERQ